MRTPHLVIQDRIIYFTLVDSIWYIALKPICEAMGLNWKHYHATLKDDPILSELSRDAGIVAADGKRRKMTCLPERYIYGWLFQLQSKNPVLLAFKRKCYDVLYDHFNGLMRGREEAIREKILAKREREQIYKQLRHDELFRRWEELQAVMMRSGKALQAADKAMELAQLQIAFDAEPATGIGQGKTNNPNT